MTHTHTQRSSHETSALRTRSAQTSPATISLRQVNRLVAGLWGALVVVLLVIAASSASYGQSATFAQTHAAAVTAPAPKNLDQVSRQISYPADARRAQHGGTVVAEVLVDRDGRPIQYAVEGEAAPELKQAVADHLLDLRFEPAQRGGEPVRMYVRIPFAFVLR